MTEQDARDLNQRINATVTHAEDAAQRMHAAIQQCALDLETAMRNLTAQQDKTTTEEHDQDREAGRT